MAKSNKKIDISANYQPLQLQEEWKLFANVTVPEDEIASVRYGNQINLADGSILNAQDVVLPEDGKIDINILLNERVPVQTPSVWVNKFVSDSNKKSQMGVGVDWWFSAYLNGELLYTTLESGGNRNAVPEKVDHIFDLPLLEGENTLVLITLAGSSSRKHAIGAVPFKDLTPKTAELRNGPYLVNPQADGCTIRFTSDGEMAGGIMYRKVGDADWKSCWHTTAAVMRRDVELHTIDLTNLQAGTDYEYKIMLQYADTNAVRVLDKIYNFNIPAQDSNEFSMLITGDTQLMPEHRLKMVNKLFAYPKASEVDYVTHIGDAGSTFNDFEPDYFDGLMDVIAEQTQNQAMYIPLRGNHEFFGSECAKYVEFFGTKEGNTFQVFRHGDTCFVVLDVGIENEPDAFSPTSYIFVEWKEYWNKQTKWLEEVAKSEIFTTAKFRVMLSHSAPALTPDYWSVTKFADEILSKHQIHLWLSGHVHEYRRSIADGKILCNGECLEREKLYSAIKYPYPIVTIDGPHTTGVELSGTILQRTKQGLELQSYDLEGNKFDHFAIAEDGKITEFGNTLTTLQLERVEK